MMVHEIPEDSTDTMAVEQKEEDGELMLFYSKERIMQMYGSLVEFAFDLATQILIEAKNSHNCLSAINTLMKILEQPTHIHCRNEKVIGDW